MIRLKEIETTVTNEHTAALKTATLAKIASELANVPVSMQAVDKAPALEAYFRANIDTILTGKPAQLRKHIRYIKQKFWWFHQYAELNPTSRSKLYVADLAAVVQAVRNAFDYDSFSSTRAGWGAYKLVKSHKLRLCPYCNLNHVNFHHCGVKGKKSRKSLEMRPPLDHYYPRANYPYLGISLYNLIPSCHQCNSSIKLQADPLTHFLPHPFHFPEGGIRFSVENVFSYRNRVGADNIKLRITYAGPAERRHMTFFRLPDRYGWYAHEIEDMHNRYLSYADVDVLKPALKTMVLGFEEKDRAHRSLGFCLHNILDEFIAHISK